MLYQHQETLKREIKDSPVDLNHNLEKMKKSDDHILLSSIKEENTLEPMGVTKIIKKTPLKRQKYNSITQKKRLELLDAVENKGERINHAAERLGINYSSAKSICQLFRKEGRAGKKISNVTKQDQIAPSHELMTRNLVLKTKELNLKGINSLEKQTNKAKTQDIGLRSLTNIQPFIPIQQSILPVNITTRVKLSEAFSVFPNPIAQIKVENVIGGNVFQTRIHLSSPGSSIITPFKNHPHPVNQTNIILQSIPTQRFFQSVDMSQPQAQNVNINAFPTRVETVQLGLPKFQQRQDIIFNPPIIITSPNPHYGHNQKFQVTPIFQSNMQIFSETGNINNKTTVLGVKIVPDSFMLNKNI